mgnify:CR=1 FL=1
MSVQEERRAHLEELKNMGITDMSILSARKSTNRRVHEIYHAMIHVNAEIQGAYIGFDPDSDTCKDCKIWSPQKTKGEKNIVNSWKNYRKNCSQNWRKSFN